MLRYLKRQIKKLPLLFTALKILRSFYKRTSAFVALVLPISPASKISPLVKLYSGSLSGLIKANLITLLKNRNTFSYIQLNQLASFINLLGMDRSAMRLFKMSILKQDIIAKEKYKELLQAFRPFSSEPFYAFGHIALMDIFVKAEHLGIVERKTNIIVDRLDKFSNPLLAEYLNETFKSTDIEHVATPKIFPKEIEEQISFFRTKGNKYLWLYDFTSLVQIEWFEKFQRRCMTLLHAKDRELALNYLNSYGFSKTNWFVAMHIREGVDILRDLRDSDPNTYIDAIKLIIAEGGWVFRIGSKNSSSEINFKSDRFIDFSQIENIPPHIDIFLLSSCRFFIGTGSGPIEVASHVFGRPVAATNWAPLGSRLSWQDQLILPKMYIRLSDSTPLNISNRVRGKFSRIESSRRLNELGYISVSNTSAQIVSVTHQMLKATQFEQFDTSSFFEHKLQENFLDLIADKGRLCPAYGANAILDEYPEFVG
jgi:putative glycosyltransferase (TIGR04372 family)